MTCDERAGFKTWRETCSRGGGLMAAEAKGLSVKLVAECPASEVPDGDYEGFWGAYTAVFVAGDATYRVRTDQGVRGLHVPCRVKVRAGVITVEALPK